ncbi:hypothetical protein AQJ91_17050 [Streptomyces dysideae]|uniref:Uncharacterized protein n=1 Tax=Streptomyces dysideae TaxID=909626 RepID=A0A117S0F8_9ACTN|nr:hypothetical protein AQJ91_17050 [Streptomyces dysideae]
MERRSSTLLPFTPKKAGSRVGGRAIRTAKPEIMPRATRVRPFSTCGAQPAWTETPRPWAERVTPWFLRLGGALRVWWGGAPLGILPR